MLKAKQQGRLITTQGAANEAERRVQDWMAAHAGTGREAARKAIATQGGNKIYRQDGLTLEAATTSPHGLAHRCAAYSAHYQPAEGQTYYTAHALVIFPSDELGPGAISLTVQQSDSWGEDTPPWRDRWEDPGEATDEIIGKVCEQEAQQLRRRRGEQKNTRFQTLQNAREAQGPVLLLTPRGNRDPALSALAQEYRALVNISQITEAEQLNMSAEVPDDWLRRWLDASAVLVKDCPEAVGRDHPLENFDQPGGLRTILGSLQKEQDQAMESLAQRSIIQVFMDMVTGYNGLQDLLDQTRRKDPEGTGRAAARAQAEDARGQEERTEAGREEGQPDGGEPEHDAGTAQAQQRISTLEDQLEEEKQRGRKAEDQLGEAQAQIQAYEQYLEEGKARSAGPPEEGRETDGPRAEMVMEAITQPGRFPHLRFLNTVNKDLEGYGKPRPTGQEIIEVLEAVEALAETYLESERGEVGSWKEHLNLPGWAYSNAESETTMGKYPKHRNFWDQEKNRRVVVQRHLTYRGSGGGLQMFFDQGGEGEPFIVAYIGEHLPYVTSRS